MGVLHFKSKEKQEEMNKEETELQRQIMLELSKYGIVIRQQSGNFYTEYGGRIKV